LSKVHREGFAGKFQSKAPAATLRIAVGDTLQMAVIEGGGGGLFSQQVASATLGGEREMSRSLLKLSKRSLRIEIYAA
jgi:hypothetical protein